MKKSTGENEGSEGFEVKTPLSFLLIRSGLRPLRPIYLVALLLAAFPLVMLHAFYGYVIRAALYLGHWPSYNNPDPKQLGWWFHHSVLQLGLIGFPSVGILAIGAAIIGRSYSRKFPFWTIIGIIILADAMLIMSMGFDPGGFADWFWD